MARAETSVGNTYSTYVDLIDMDPEELAAAQESGERVLYMGLLATAAARLGVAIPDIDPSMTAADIREKVEDLYEACRVGQMATK